LEKTQLTMKKDGCVARYLYNLNGELRKRGISAYKGTYKRVKSSKRRGGNTTDSCEREDVVKRLKGERKTSFQTLWWEMKGGGTVIGAEGKGPGEGASLGK